MLVNIDKMVPISDANQNFSKVAKMVDEEKAVVIMKNNKPKYVIIEFEEFSKDALFEDEKINSIADRILNKNLEAFKELAK